MRKKREKKVSRIKSGAVPRIQYYIPTCERGALYNNNNNNNDDDKNNNNNDDNNQPTRVHGQFTVYAD